MIGKTRRDRIRNEDSLKQVGVEGVHQVISKARLRWCGHSRRMEEHRTTLYYYNYKLNEKRRRGRPRKRWSQIIAEDIRTRGHDPTEIEAEQKFLNRLWWRGLVSSRPILNEGTE
uniref:Uncharacterized protein n=1 Tax=Cacopsylla melanoneura TaxID=428564 RepID=A0A8D9BD87_9HEMI